MVSTQPGTYGNPAKGTEVPRDPLMSALDEVSTLVRSDSFDITTKALGAIKAAEGSDALPTPKVGTMTKGNLYVEYSF
jgi:hypothetical protein